MPRSPLEISAFHIIHLVQSKHTAGRHHIMYTFRPRSFRLRAHAHVLHG